MRPFSPIHGTAMMAAALVAVGAQADSFGSGANAFTLDFVDIGYAGNAGDTANTVNGVNPGSVGYNYQMGMHEVSIDQFTKANNAAGGALGNNNENPFSGGVNRAASSTSWLEAAKFANYLTSGTYNGGAYQFSGVSTLTGVDRDAAVLTYGTVYVLPTEDEWYKAAYYKPVNDGSYSLYANGDGTVAVPGTAPTHGTANGWNYSYAVGVPDYIWDVGFGAEEQNGTYDMMGNVWEWTESSWFGTDNILAMTVCPSGSSSGTTYLSESGASTGRLTQYGRNARGWVGNVVFADGLTNAYTNNGLGYLTDMVDRAGRQTDYTYAPGKRITSVMKYLEQNDQAVPVRTGYDLDEQTNLLRISELRTAMSKCA